MTTRERWNVKRQGPLAEPVSGLIGDAALPLKQVGEETRIADGGTAHSVTQRHWRVFRLGS